MPDYTRQGHGIDEYSVGSHEAIVMCICLITVKCILMVYGDN